MPDLRDQGTLPAEPRRRDVVTPYSFQVHPPLLGLPLAEPWRRAVAITIDGLLIGLLSLVPNALLTLVTGAVIFRWAGQTRHPWSMRRRGWLRAGAVVMILVGAIFLWSGFRVEIGEDPRAPEGDWDVDLPVEIAPSSSEVAADTEPPRGRTREAVHSVIEWGKGLLDDLGIGLGWAALYFTVFPAWWIGQTPGKKLLGIRVVQLDGSPISLWEAFERCGGYGAGLATGLLGFIQVWWDPNRQAIHDKIAETVVIRGDVPSPLDPL